MIGIEFQGTLFQTSFQIKIINRVNRKKPEIRLNFQIDQKYKDLLLLIKDNFGGNIGYRFNQDTYYYESTSPLESFGLEGSLIVISSDRTILQTSFGSAKKFITFFDQFHLLSCKYINYLKWRKAYLLIQNKEHLTEKGIRKIIKLKETMNNFNKDVMDLS